MATKRQEDEIVSLVIDLSKDVCCIRIGGVLTINRSQIMKELNIIKNGNRGEKFLSVSFYNGTGSKKHLTCSAEENQASIKVEKGKLVITDARCSLSKSANGATIQALIQRLADNPENTSARISWGDPSIYVALKPTKYHVHSNVL